MDINHNEGLIVDFYSYRCLFSLHYTCDVVQTFIYSETAHQADIHARIVILMFFECVAMLVV